MGDFSFEMETAEMGDCSASFTFDGPEAEVAVNNVGGGGGGGGVPAPRPRIWRDE